LSPTISDIPIIFTYGLGTEEAAATSNEEFRISTRFMNRSDGETEDDIEKSLIIDSNGKQCKL